MQKFWPWWLANENRLMQECLYYTNKTELDPGYPSEMVLLRRYYGDSPCLDYYFPEIASYKMHILTKFISLKEASIVYFHGKPKPHELTGPWLGVHWV